MNKVKYFFRLIGDLFKFARDHKKLWMTPIFVLLILLTVIVVLGSGPLAPFIYTLF